MPADLPHRAVPFPITFQGRTATLLRPANPDEVLNSITDEQFSKDEFLPYWAEHWPSANALLTYLEANPLPPEARICELGSGLGAIASCMARQARFIVATDISHDACRYARTNMISPWVESALAESPRVDTGASRQHTDTMLAAVCIDWRNPPFRPTFSTIVGSDILYEKRWIEPVLDFMSTTLTEYGNAIIADPCRTHWKTFLHEARQRGFSTTIVHSQIVNEGRMTAEVALLVKAQ